jgi:hypothetical protein
LAKGSSDPDLRIEVQYSSGVIGTYRQLFASPLDDVLVVVASFVHRPTAYLDRGISCTLYIVPGISPTGVRGAPVVSILSSAGGQPVLSSGVIASDAPDPT